MRPICKSDDSRHGLCFTYNSQTIRTLVVGSRRGSLGAFYPRPESGGLRFGFAPRCLSLRSAKPPHSFRPRVQLVPQPENRCVPLPRPFAPARYVSLQLLCASVPRDEARPSVGPKVWASSQRGTTSPLEIAYPREKRLAARR